MCHTCLPEVQQNGEISFQASSPDELALVEAARDLGYIVIDRITQSITLLTYPSGSDLVVWETYEVLDVIEFSNKRKRMSIIVRFPNGKICIFCKGTDSVIHPRFKLASLALWKASQVERRHSLRIGDEAEEALLRKSELQGSRNSFHRSSLSLGRPSINRRSTAFRRTSISSIDLAPIHDEMSSRLRDRENGVYGDDQESLRTRLGNDRRRSLAPSKPRTSMQNDYLHVLQGGAQLLDEAGTFERCLKHINDFASEGL
jgi:phospholipid-translocating ATPase